MTPDEIKEQMELCDSDDRRLLTDEELSSRQNISHNSDNGYLYQDADFLCGAIIKERKALAEANRLLGTMNLESICDVLGCLIYDENANAFPEKHFNQADMVELEDIYEKLDDLRDTIAAALKGVAE